MPMTGKRRTTTSQQHASCRLPPLPCKLCPLGPASPGPSELCWVQPAGTPSRLGWRRWRPCGSTLERKAGHRRSRSDAAVQSVVDFMYRNDNTTTLSWGSTRLKVGGKVEVIQARNRLQSLGRLWAAYDREMVDTPPKDRVRRTMFYELGGAITARDLKVGGG